MIRMLKAGLFDFPDYWTITMIPRVLILIAIRATSPLRTNLFRA